jgi:hypothetical protein
LIFGSGISQYPSDEPYQTALTRLKKLEDQANKKAKLGRYMAEIDLEEEANDLFISNIKKKLELLKSSAE